MTRSGNRIYSQQTHPLRFAHADRLCIDNFLFGKRHAGAQNGLLLFGRPSGGYWQQPFVVFRQKSHAPIKSKNLAAATVRSFEKTTE